MNSKMEESFRQLQRDGKNCVDNIIQWMQEAELVERTREAEERARELFSEIKNQHDVEFEKFKEVLEKVAEEQKKTVEHLSNMLMTGIPKLHEALKAAADAFQKTMQQ